MKRIDFLGSPGVGKSTIYSELIKCRNKSSNWVTPEEAALVLAEEYLAQSTGTTMKYFAIATFRIPFLFQFNKLFANQIINKYGAEILKEKGSNYSDFLDAALSGILSKEKEPMRRLIGINWFYGVYKRTILFENSKSKRTVLFDESLSQKVYGIILSKKSFLKKTIPDYFKFMPSPAGLVYCKTDIEELFERITKRHKVIAGHSALSKEELLEYIEVQAEISAIGKNIIKSRDIPVIEIDTSNSLEYNTKVIDAFIKEINDMNDF